MKAAYYDRQGPAREVLQVGNLPDPAPGPGEVLVRVEMSGVNPSDVKGRQGGRAPMAHPRIVPHSDASGTIVAVGDGVSPARIGEHCWTYNVQWERAFGTAAELVVLSADRAVPLPQGMDFASGACLGIPAMTAHRAVFADGPVTDKWVLVTGGAGSVGHYAIQFAKWGGAKVITTVSGDAKAAHARQAGADVVLNYRTDDVVACVLELTDGKGVDRIVDVEFGGNIDVTQKVIRLNGTIASYASAAVREPAIPFYVFMYKNVTLRTVLVYNMPEEAKAAAIRDIARAQGDGALKHAIGATFSLDEIAAAHEAVEQGTMIGNVVVQVR